MTAQRDERRLAAILAADIVGYTRLMGADESGTFARLKALRSELIEPKIASYGGRIFKLMGDGMLAEFPSVVDAVQCAVEVQGAMAERETDLSQDRRLQFRIGVNLGDVIVDGDDIYGDGVNIAARLEPELGAAERQRVERKSPQNLDAWDSYHLGLSCMYRYTMDGNAEAQRLFRRVIEIDPGFAPAHAGLAYTMFLSAVYFGAEPDTELLDESLREAQEAVALDDKDAMSYFILGRIRLIRRDYELSIADLETAIELNPCLATAHCGLGDSLAYSGRLAEAIPRFEEALHLSPHDPRKWAFLVYGSLALLSLERYEEAAEWANRAVGVPNATFWANAQLVAVLSHWGRIEDARGAAKDLLRREPDFSATRFAENFLFYVKDPNRMEKYRDGLRKAGLPE